MGRQVRRVVLILLALVLTPSIATASWYRCAIDGTTRSSCLPAPTKRERKTPANGPSARAACCCTVTHVTSTPPPAQAIHALDVQQPPAIAAVVQVARPHARVEIASVDRPRAQGDPPDTLFARRCSMLL